MYRYRIEYVKHEEDHMTILKDTRAIIRSLENHDKSLALEMMKKHIETQKQIVKQSIREK